MQHRPRYTAFGWCRFFEGQLAREWTIKKVLLGISGSTVMEFFVFTNLQLRLLPAHNRHLILLRLSRLLKKDKVYKKVWLNNATIALGEGRHPQAARHYMSGMRRCMKRFLRPRTSHSLSWLLSLITLDLFAYDCTLCHLVAVLVVVVFIVVVVVVLVVGWCFCSTGTDADGGTIWHHWKGVKIPHDAYGGWSLGFCMPLYYWVAETSISNGFVSWVLSGPYLSWVSAITLG